MRLEFPRDWIGIAQGWSRNSPGISGIGNLGFCHQKKKKRRKITAKRSNDQENSRIQQDRVSWECCCFRGRTLAKFIASHWIPVGIAFPEKDSKDFNPRMIPNSTAGVRSPWESRSQKEIPRMIPNSIASYWIPVGTAFPKEDSKDFNPRTIPTFTTNHWGSVGIVKFHGDRLEILEIPTQR